MFRMYSNALYLHQRYLVFVLGVRWCRDWNFACACFYDCLIDVCTTDRPLRFMLNEKLRMNTSAGLVFHGKFEIYFNKRHGSLHITKLWSLLSPCVVACSLILLLITDAYLSHLARVQYVFCWSGFGCDKIWISSVLFFVFIRRQPTVHSSHAKTGPTRKTHFSRTKCDTQFQMPKSCQNRC